MSFPVGSLHSYTSIFTLPLDVYLDLKTGSYKVTITSSDLVMQLGEMFALALPPEIDLGRFGFFSEPYIFIQDNTVGHLFTVLSNYRNAKDIHITLIEGTYML